MFGRRQGPRTEMDAVVVRIFGGLDVLRAEQREIPQPGNDEVLVAVKTIGINPLDWKVRRGEAFADHFAGRPAVLGWDLSGVVSQVGRRVTSFASGDEVYGLGNFPAPAGAYAEYTTVPANDLLRKPDQLTHIQAAALPMSGMAAWQALFTDARISGSHRILIHGAAGGIGHIAVQLAKWAGATVVATASARNAEYLTRLGADEVIDYNAERAFEGVSAVDVILDLGGCTDNPELLSTLVRWGKHIVFCGRRSPSPRLKYFALRPDRQSLEKLANLVIDGTVRLSTTTVSSLESIAQAHSMSESGHVRGKIVVIGDAGH
ncbi:MAG: zinc-binding dehydrogenase [Spirochaetes bacterium]|nr:zinc-binding dehydrogenase [Spirochaetota bacterium]